MAESEVREITVEWLRERRACSWGVGLFVDTFGASASLTRANLLRAVEAGFSLDWLAGELLTAAARAEYDRAMAAARAEYGRAMAAARAEYDRAMAAARAEYDRAMAAALADAL